ncbi:condensation domain-containing protein [Streptomyces sp. NPDC091212]|uniref:condensation domain-containing protein n=1 Tax=Streptomyces sp. NPDC091212 TaxID=3155191 RepID=UPI0034151471
MTAGPGRATSVEPQPVPGAAPRAVPASSAQERVWFADRMAPDASAYRIVDELVVHAEVTEADLRGAFALLVRRHEALRTALRIVDGRLTQYVLPRIDPELRHTDLTGADDARQADVRRSRRAELVRLPFDLERAPLWRAELLALGETQWAVVFAAHHVVYDAASRFNLHVELTEICAAVEQGREPKLPELPLSYTGYAQRERDRLSPPRRAELAAYWRTRLAGLPPVHRLPLDRPRPAARTFEGAEVRACLPPEVTASLPGSARRLGTEPVMLCLAAYVALLHRHSGQEDIVVGLPVTGRRQADLLPMIGTFVNMLVVRVDVSGTPAFAELVGRVRAAAHVEERYDIPFQTLVELLPVPRLPGVPPLYQLAFNHVPAGGGPGAAPSGSGGCEDDLLLEVTADTVRIEYNAALVEKSTADTLLADYLALLVAGLSDADMPLPSLPVAPRTGDTRAPRPARTATGGEPRTATAKLVADAWRAVLGTAVTDVHDDFFHLGGHSVQALRMLSRLAADHDAELSIRRFFADPTVAGLATELERKRPRRTTWR